MSSLTYDFSDEKPKQNDQIYINNTPKAHLTIQEQIKETPPKPTQTKINLDINTLNAIQKTDSKNQEIAQITLGETETSASNYETINITEMEKPKNINPNTPATIKMSEQSHASDMSIMKDFVYNNNDEQTNANELKLPKLSRNKPQKSQYSCQDAIFNRFNFNERWGFMPLAGRKIQQFQTIISPKDHTSNKLRYTMATLDFRTQSKLITTTYETLIPHHLLPIQTKENFVKILQMCQLISHKIGMVKTKSGIYWGKNFISTTHSNEVNLNKKVGEPCINFFQNTSIIPLILKFYPFANATSVKKVLQIGSNYGRILSIKDHTIDINETVKHLKKDAHFRFTKNDYYIDRRMENIDIKETVKDLEMYIYKAKLEAGSTSMAGRAKPYILLIYSVSLSQQIYRIIENGGDLFQLFMDVANESPTQHPLNYLKVSEILVREGNCSATHKRLIIIPTKVGNSAELLIKTAKWKFERARYRNTLINFTVIESHIEHTDQCMAAFNLSEKYLHFSAFRNKFQTQTYTNKWNEMVFYLCFILLENHLDMWNIPWIKLITHFINPLEILWDNMKEYVIMIKTERKFEEINNENETDDIKMENVIELEQQMKLHENNRRIPLNNLNNRWREELKEILIVILDIVPKASDLKHCTQYTLWNWIVTILNILDKSESIRKLSAPPIMQSEQTFNKLVGRITKMKVTKIGPTQLVQARGQTNTVNCITFKGQSMLAVTGDPGTNQPTQRFYVDGRVFIFGKFIPDPITQYLMEIEPGYCGKKLCCRQPWRPYCTEYRKILEANKSENVLFFSIACTNCTSFHHITKQCPNKKITFCNQDYSSTHSSMMDIELCLFYKGIYHLYDNIIKIKDYCSEILKSKLNLNLLHIERVMEYDIDKLNPNLDMDYFYCKEKIVNEKKKKNKARINALKINQMSLNTNNGRKKWKKKDKQTQIKARESLKPLSESKKKSFKELQSEKEQYKSKENNDLIALMADPEMNNLFKKGYNQIKNKSLVCLQNEIRATQLIQHSPKDKHSMESLNILQKLANQTPLPSDEERDQEMQQIRPRKRHSNGDKVRRRDINEDTQTRSNKQELDYEPPMKITENVMEKTDEEFTLLATQIMKEQKAKRDQIILSKSMDFKETGMSPYTRWMLQQNKSKETMNNNARIFQQGQASNFLGQGYRKKYKLKLNKVSEPQIPPTLQLSTNNNKNYSDEQNKHNNLI